MKLSPSGKVIITAALFTLLAASAGCSSGADIYLQNISVGSFSADGKPVTGLPSQKANIVLKTSATKILVNQSGGKTIITLQPSGAVITSSSEGLSFTGVEEDQVEIKWTTDNTTK
ncbi:MAG: hypothetical protein JXA01_09175 [Dehalococcoidia bacterium]|nr:hypothetical protein [Dehalococcoidia bacterium]